ncbi:MAG: hypothetical protein N2512_05400 [Armatimonadetes bacterium]|nr:hypothetical protein [Armatimonadota bacterium]
MVGQPRRASGRPCGATTPAGTLPNNDHSESPPKADSPSTTIPRFGLSPTSAARIHSPSGSSDTAESSKELFRLCHGLLLDLCADMVAGQREPLIDA